jgi:flavin-dependent dehydrogenase
MKGAEILEGNLVNDLKINENEATVLLQNGTSYRADLIIGADGARSIIAEKSKIFEKSPLTRKGLCVVNESQVPTAELDELYGNKRATHYFYGFGGIIGYSWVFPKKNHMNIGIGGPSNTGRELGHIFPKFLTFLRENGMIPNGFEMKTRFKAALIPLSTALYLKRSYADRVLLVGDALGVVSSVSGEGIYQSMASGEDAGTMASAALDEGKFDALFLKQYEKIWKKDLGGELKTVGNIMQLSSTETKEELLKKINSVFEKMKEDKNFFDFFANTFFGFQ